jgi:hypothetical protein
MIWANGSSSSGDDRRFAYIIIRNHGRQRGRGPLRRGGFLEEGGEASSKLGGFAVSLDEASSAGVTEQGGEFTPTVADEGTNEGGPAPS